ncbi:winged helix DNA-binding domain-containing protein [Williamsia sterculiae]|uniref:Winged helix DNA-binding domain-containing protein n=1 Tax=Williamsia sterculiae TaxID=1344003 RepID=A0A1N7GYW1_9NOCA|nr:winged helix DNA-binding domain-containing protein [Williamsia sterculiae]SIS17784.1 Winged helix DNA-binding domain-containing protein [Williamsia sterculiae]
MSTPRVDDAQRRARLLRRHGFAEPRRPDDLVGVCDAMIGLHATTPSTVHLSAWARTRGPGPDPQQVGDLLHERRELVKQLAMRRTLFVVSREVLPDTIGAVGARVAGTQRTAMVRDLRRTPGVTDPDELIDAAARVVVGTLADGVARSAAELRLATPQLQLPAMHQMTSRVLNMLSAAGQVVRGPNDAPWHRSRPRWSSMAAWLGSEPAIPDAATALRAMVRRWLATFGPGTETDIVWWLGSTKAAVRAALAALDVAEVGLDDGQTGYLLADDLAPVDPVPPGALLLPELDPTTMGWKQRDFYLGPHAPALFDRNGNGGQTAWWDGRVVGGWFRRDDGSVGLHLLESLPRNAQRALAVRADDLATWLGEVRPRPSFPAPFMADLG